MRARRGRTAVVALAATLLLTGCQQVRQVLVGPSDDELLEAVSLAQRDAAPAATFELNPGGDEVAGQVSLDLCYGDFPSEALRVARHQVSVGDQSGAWVSSEAILYDSPAEAEQAMGELRRAQRDCPEGPVDSGDGESVTWRFAAAPDTAWPQEPGIARQAYAFTVSASGQSWQGTATYLQRGRMILALYAAPPGAPAELVRNAPDPARFVAVMARRLATLPQDALESGSASRSREDPNDLEA